VTLSLVGWIDLISCNVELATKLNFVIQTKKGLNHILGSLLAARSHFTLVELTFL
jgi:hypothetical protein